MRAASIISAGLSAAALTSGLDDSTQLDKHRGITFAPSTLTLTASNSGLTVTYPASTMAPREMKHISGPAGQRIWHSGRIACENARPWLVCMKAYHDQLDLNYDANLRGDKSTVAASRLDASPRLWQWARDECTLREGSDDWDDCMEQFWTEVSEFYLTNLERFDPDIDARDPSLDFPDVGDCDANLPTDIGETTTLHLSDQGQSYTAVLALEHAKPHRFSDVFYASGTKYTVIISQFAASPTVVAQTVIWGPETNVKFTTTSDPSCIGKLTSVDFGARFPKRAVPASTSYGVHSASSTVMPSENTRVDERPTQYVDVRPYTTITTTLSGSTVPLTAPTQIVAGTTFIRDPNAKFYNHNPYLDGPVTGSCHDVKRSHWNEKADKNDNSNWPEEIHDFNATACNIERCMWDFMKPIDISTVTFLNVQDSPHAAQPFTYRTHLRSYHWGTTEDFDVYYPKTLSRTIVNGTQTHKVVLATPSWMNKSLASIQHVHTATPECHSLDSCVRLCEERNPQPTWFEDHWPWIVGLIGGLLALLAFACCVICLRGRSSGRRRSSLSDKLKRKQSEKPVTSQNPENSGSSTAAGSAAGTESARQEGGEDDGRGTTGRRAEEGRGRVNFEDGGHPGQESTVEHVDPQPVPHTDGASDGHGTGRPRLDLGSLRGRKAMPAL